MRKGEGIIGGLSTNVALSPDRKSKRFMKMNLDRVDSFGSDESVEDERLTFLIKKSYAPNYDNQGNFKRVSTIKR